MKRIQILIALAFICSSAFAQSMYDALTISENDYYGTARSIALGNAVTALGGDLGTIGINPAGSAVAGYSQISLTPGISVARTSSYYNSNEPSSIYANMKKGNRTWMTMPSGGFSLNCDLGKSSGLKSFTFAFVANTTARYGEIANVSGSTSNTSLGGSLAAMAQGYTVDILNDYYSGSPWPACVGLRSGMIYRDDASHSYLGASETTNASGQIYTADAVAHNAVRETSGNKTDIIINMGFNVDDRLFLGFNLGVPSVNLGVSNYITERAVDPASFPQYFDAATTNWTKSTYGTVYDAEMSGVYAKVGLIWTPFPFIRLGAAVQTPTRMDISERYTFYGSSSYADSGFNDSETSPEGSYQYKINTPMRTNLGLALVLGKWGLVSADWEFCDYSTMAYHAHAGNTPEDFILVNETNSLFAGKSNIFRLGVEARLTRNLSLRGGLSRTSSPEYYWYDNDGYYVDAGEYLAYYDDFQTGVSYLCDRGHIDAPTTVKSIGLGFASDGSFFADFAFRSTSRPSSYYNLYDTYIPDSPSPSYRVDKRLSEMVLTVGWRF